ncbi:amino acid adenylation domain-containing protein [Amycolatopsis bartoniae]|uniref:Carrier domain-containing protein n=1 Tax=Amycolatopsis bartoniae TaxID=941986 RepID=A0A8H9MCB2_9PSEU|nr:non-ribosomal peptide synthetase [Amycolatopsis bartoniae]MBB2938466.1 amino acid adenylation domain-containing protein [Amycolatopsis bartoniae]GHF70801.1 hypothetical protein GCM10017566_50790 [Amycolatopsis bartoniae]
MPIETLPLTAAQTGVWFAQQLDPANPSYNAAEAVHIDGAVDVPLLTAALRQTVDEAEAVRARFDEDAHGRVRQVIEPLSDWQLPVVDLRETGDPDAAAEEYMGADLRQPVDLRQAPLFAFALLRTGDARWVAYFRLHHAVLDGFGFALFIQRVAALYTAAEERTEPPPCPFGSLRELLAEEAGYRRSERFTQDREYWAGQLAGWPAQRSRTPWSIVPHAFVRETGHLAPEDAAGLRALARQARTSLPPVAMAALALYVHRLTGRDDVSLELTVNARPGKLARCVPSMVASVLPLRTALTPATSVLDAVRGAADNAKQLLRHQRYSSADLVRDLGLAPHLGGYLGDWGINIMMHDARLRFGRHSATLHNLSNGPVTGLGVNVYDRPSDGSLRIDFNADPGKYDAATLAAHHRRFLRLLRTLATADPGQPVGTLDLLDAGERELVLHTWNDTARPVQRQTLPELFQDQARRRPEANALVCGEITLSTADLNKRANRLAHLLLARGAGPETRVAVALPRTADAMVALLAVLKAGAACVPLDIGQPPARLACLLDDAAPLCVLTTTDVPLPEGHPLLLLDESDVDSQADTDPDTAPQPGHAAYLSFTSGSTGAPKAVVVEHRQLANLYADHHAELIAGRRLRSAVTASFSFDTFWESMLFLAAGQEVHLVDDATRLDPAALVRYFHRHRIDFADLTPSLVCNLLAHGLYSGPEKFPWQLMVGGEAIDAQLWTTLEKTSGVSAWNFYGPTESTVDAVYCRIRGQRPVIGKPGHNVQAYVLDAALQPQPPLVPGELYLAGAQLARGYHDRPGLTAERFVPNPFGPPGARLYRTGDVVRWTADGDLEYLGRADSQLKLHGVRIEPGEVETALLSHPGVAQAVVTSTGRALVAHVVPRAEPVAEAELRTWAAQRLPAAMVPSTFVPLRELPLTAHGKLDHAALPAAERRAGREAETTRERQLCVLFAEVLGLDHVGVDDDFFALGGHSLLAAALVGRLRADLGAEVALGAVYQAPTVAELARHLDQAAPARALDALLPLRAAGNQPPLFCVHPAGGLAWCYAGLPRHLPAGLPVYGLQSPGLDKPGELPATFPQLVDDYVRRIRSVRPSGPYRLLGWSLGGALAHAIAARLQAGGEHVALLAQLDSRPIDPALVLGGRRTSRTDAGADHRAHHRPCALGDAAAHLPRVGVRRGPRVLPCHARRIRRRQRGVGVADHRPGAHARPRLHPPHDHRSPAARRGGRRADRISDRSRGTAIFAGMSEFDIPDTEVLRARQKLVLDHFRDEVAQDWDATLSTFPHPHYELIATMTVHDGDSDVRGYYHDTRVAFPDQHHELISLRHSKDAVAVEFWLLGTHLGPFGQIPATGSKFRVRMTAYFVFDEHENLVCERVYFDSLTMLKQLIGGIDKRNPRNWPLLAKVVRGLLKMSGEQPDPRLLRTTEPELEALP